MKSALPGPTTFVGAKSVATSGLITPVAYEPA